MKMQNYLKKHLQCIKNKVQLEVQLNELIKNHLTYYYNLDLFNIFYLKLEKQ